MWLRKRLLIWGTTYPEFSSKYYETVCTGAIDAETGKLVRIYPITLRHRGDDRFRHYQWIEADVERRLDADFRPESFRINQDTIQLGERLDTKDGWGERSRWVLQPPNMFQSVEALRAAEERDHTSLGLVKPKAIREFYVWTKPPSARKEWEEARESALAQRDLFVDPEAETKDLVYMPIQYRARFVCDDPACTTEHDFSILDWGVYVQSRREFALKGGAHAAQRSVIAHLQDCMDPIKKDAYFFLGNTLRHPQSFMIVGVYYPPRPKAPPPPPPPPAQGSLF